MKSKQTINKSLLKEQSMKFNIYNKKKSNFKINYFKKKDQNYIKIFKKISQIITIKIA